MFTSVSDLAARVAEAKTKPLSSSLPRQALPGRGFRVGLFVVLAANVVLITLFMNRSWIPADDGQYVHIADRIASGQVLNGDVEELHPGYGHFINAWSLQIFGERIVSLRYPLMALVMAQSIGTFALFRRKGVLAATVAAVAMSAIGTFQISNPTPSLYALGLTVGVVGLLSTSTPSTRHRVIRIGALLGLIFLFRQLTAVFVAMGVFAFLFTEQQDDEPATAETTRGVSRAVLGLALIGLVGYLVTSTGVGGAMLYGIWPIAILGQAIQRSTLGNRAAGRLLGHLGAGALASALPLVGYHLWHGSLWSWLGDVFIRSLSVAELDHIRVFSQLGHLVSPALINIFTFRSAQAVVNGVFWIALVFAAFGLGLRVFRAVLSRQAPITASMALPMVAVFYALVSVFNQIPYYLFLTAGLSLVAGLWMRTGGDRGAEPIPRQIRGRVLWVAALSLIAVIFHAGQPYNRIGYDLVAGERMPLVESEIPRLGLMIDPAEEQEYVELLSYIDQATEPTDTLFALPNDAELYFLADRENPFRFFSPTVSITSDEELDAFVDEFAIAEPTMIVRDTQTAYNTERIELLLDEVLDDYRPATTVGKYQVYLRR